MINKTITMFILRNNKFQNIIFLIQIFGEIGETYVKMKNEFIYIAPISPVSCI